MPKPIAEIRRPEIVAAAVGALREHGLPYPSYDAVAGEAAMSRQLIRHYFPEPEGLMVMACETLGAAYRDSIARGFVAAEPRQRLPMFLDFYFGFMAQNGLPKPEDDAVYDAMFALANTSHGVKERLHEQYGELQGAFAAELAASHPDLSPAACQEIGFLFVSLMYGHWRMIATLGFDETYSAVAREAMDRIIASYREHGATPRDAEPELDQTG